MKKVVLNYLVIAALVVSAACTSCGGSGSGSGGGKSSGKIKMTTEQGGEFYIALTGNGIATVDWGDGSEKVMLTLNENGVGFEHSYSSATIRTIIINGDNITGLGCENITSLDVSRCTELTELNILNSKFTSLDLSKNIALTNLFCQSNLTKLDVSNNKVLTRLVCNYNQLTGSALNALFESLPDNAGKKFIYIHGNPGAEDCNLSIAERKGWSDKE